MSAKLKPIVWGMVIAVIAFFAGSIREHARSAHRTNFSSKTFSFGDREIVLRYFAEWHGFTFLETNSSSLEIGKDGDLVTIFKAKRIFQESFRHVDTVETNENTVSWDDGLDRYQLTITPLPSSE